MSIPKRLRASKQNPCRICQKGNDFCINYEDGNTICMIVQTPDAKLIRFKDGQYGYFYPASTNLNNFVLPTRPKKEKNYTEHPLAPLSVRHRAYSILLEYAFYCMSDEHFNHLTQERKFAEEALTNFGTLDDDYSWRQSVAREVSQHVDLKGVPGFFESYQGWTVGGPSGILIPCRTPKGHIQGFQIRLDKVADGPKYKWLSTPPDLFNEDRQVYPNGTACPRFLNFANFKMSPDVWVTEGPLKAMVAAAHTGQPFVGMPGVYITNVDMLAEIKTRCGSQYILCPDADFRANLHVYNGWISSLQQLTGKYVPVKMAVWPPEDGKGIDDLILNTGKLPKYMAPEKFIKLWPEEKIKAAHEARNREKAA